MRGQIASADLLAFCFTEACANLTEARLNVVRSYVISLPMSSPA